MLGKLCNENNILKKNLLFAFVALVILFTGTSRVYAAQVAPVSALPLQGNSSAFQWGVTQSVEIAETKEELMQQYVEKISRVPEDQSTFTIRLTATKDIYEWAIKTAVDYNSLPTRDNPLVQNSYHIFSIRPRPYYAGSNVRKFDLLISVGKDINDQSLHAESIRTTKEMAVVAHKVARNIESLDDRAKLNYIDDWIAYHFSYDYSLKKYTAAEGYKTGQFVCAGYTEMFKLIADYAGLENKVEVVSGNVDVEGTQGYHSWIIYTDDDGVRYLIDPTHNDYYDTTSSAKYWFMLDESTVTGYTQTHVLKPLQAVFEQ